MKDKNNMPIMRKQVDFNLLVLCETLNCFMNTMIFPEDVTEAMNNLHDVIELYFNNTEGVHCDIEAKYFEEIYRV